MKKNTRAIALIDDAIEKAVLSLNDFGPRGTSFKKAGRKIRWEVKSHLPEVISLLEKIQGEIGKLKEILHVQ
jgi:hypothetical protein